MEFYSAVPIRNDGSLVLDSNEALTGTRLDFAEQAAQEFARSHPNTTYAVVKVVSLFHTSLPERELTVIAREVTGDDEIIARTTPAIEDTTAGVDRVIVDDVEALATPVGDRGDDHRHALDRLMESVARANIAQRGIRQMTAPPVAPAPERPSAIDWGGDFRTPRGR